MKPIKNCTNQQLKKIYNKSTEIQKINLVVQKFLPEFLRNQCMVGSFINGTLVLFTHNSGIAYKLNFLIPDLIETLRKQGKIYELINIKIKISQMEMIRTPKAKPHKEISSMSKQIIKENASQIEFEPLKKALLKLSESEYETE